MSPVVVIPILAGLILLLLIIGAPIKPLRLFGQAAVKILIGAILLFFLNAFGASLGVFVPINIATATVTGLLGIPGLAALVVIQMWII